MTGLFLVHQQPWTRLGSIQVLYFRRDITAKHSCVTQCFLKSVKKPKKQNMQYMRERERMREIETRENERDREKRRERGIFFCYFLQIHFYTYNICILIRCEQIF